MIRFPLRSLRFTMAGAAVLLAAAPALGAERWAPAATGAAVVLPTPSKADGILGGSLFCREQQWAFLLRTDRAGEPASVARMTVDKDEFTSPASASADAVTILVSRKLLQSLRDGTALTVSLGKGSEALSARFALGNSRAAIEAAAPLCSPPNVSGFEAVRLQPEGPAIETAGRLMEEELALLREATTGVQPVLAATEVEADSARKLLFASLCGSQRYYGESGCKLMGFASEAGGEWRPVYDTEGMQLYRDPARAHGGWPDLMTLPMIGEPKRIRWMWNGEGYEASTDDAAVAGEQRGPLDGLRTGATAE